MVLSQREKFVNYYNMDMAIARKLGIGNEKPIIQKLEAMRNVYLNTNNDADFKKELDKLGYTFNEQGDKM